MLKNTNKMKQTKHVRIINSTYNSNDMKKSMIGDICEVAKIDFKDRTVGVWNKDKTDYFFFNFDDVQEVCLEAVVEGYVLGVGDKYLNKTIIGFYKYDRIIRIILGADEDTYLIDSDSVSKSGIIPLYKSPKETIKIGERLYDKTEVEKALATLKEIK
jgi:hypothetical protein